MMQRLYRLAAVVLVLWAAGCSGLSPGGDDDPIPGSGCVDTIEIFLPLDGAVVPVGTDTTLEVATWNLEFFPLAPNNDPFECPIPNSPARIQKTAELINALAIDVIAVQEISVPGGFAELLALCPDYGGALVTESHGCNYQRTGVIYRKSVVTMNSFRTLNELSVFTREPFEADMTTTQNGRTYRFRLISLHLKAGGDGSDVSRRQAETTALHAYLESRSISDPGLDYIVAGDWNDVLTDPMSTTSFPAFLKDPEDFTFVTDPLKSRSDMASLGNRLIDLILVNDSACPDFTGARVTTLRLDAIVPGYSSLVSDHRPVLVSAPIFN